MSYPRFSSLEVLESRIAPAAAGHVTPTYNAATGELMLAGTDQFGHGADIFPTGLGTFRVEGDGHTLFDMPSGQTMAFDIGKLTKLTVTGGAGIHLFQVRTLTAIDFTGGAGGDLLAGTDVSVKGDVVFHGGAGKGTVTFDGSSTIIGGQLIVDATGATGMDFAVVNLSAETTTVGSVAVTGGAGASTFLAGGAGAVTIKKGLSFSSGAGSAEVTFANEGRLMIGNSAPGEQNDSIFIGGAGISHALSFSQATVSLAGAIEMAGTPGADSIDFLADTGLVKVGKLPSGESIVLTGLAGDDILTFGGAGITLAGGVNFAGGDGNNSLVAVLGSGPLSLGKDGTGASIHYAGGVNSNSVTLLAKKLTLAGGIDFSVTGGNSGLSLGVTGGQATVGKLGSGESLKYLGGTSSGNAGIDATVARFAGGIDFNVGGGAGALIFTDLDGVVSVGKLASGYSIKYTGGTGTDKLEFSGRSTTLAGGIDFSGGEGTNDVKYFNAAGAAKIGASPGGFSLHVTGGTGMDSLRGSLSSLALAGAIDDSAGGGSNELFLTAKVMTIGKTNSGQSVALTGVGNADDTLSLEGSTRLSTTGSVEMTGGSGTDVLTFRGHTSVGKNHDGFSLEFNGLEGASEVIFDQALTFTGSVDLVGGSGTDNFSSGGALALSVKGSFRFTGGGGADVVYLQARSLFVAGDFTFFGGDGADDIAILSNGTIAGDTIIRLGTSDGSEDVELLSLNHALAGLLLKGKLVIDSEDITTAGATVTFTNLAVAKTIDVTLRAGADQVTIDNLIAGSTLKVDTADGDDTVAIEQKDFFGNSLVRGLATILLGEGNNDRLDIGKATPLPNSGLVDSTRVNFLNGLTADGGDGGNDTRNDFENQNDFHGIAPTIVHF